MAWIVPFVLLCVYFGADATNDPVRLTAMDDIALSLQTNTTNDLARSLKANKARFFYGAATSAYQVPLPSNTFV
jgi:hypothetical protein